MRFINLFTEMQQIKCLYWVCLVSVSSERDRRNPIFLGFLNLFRIYLRDRTVSKLTKIYAKNPFIVVQFNLSQSRNPKKSLTILLWPATPRLTRVCGPYETKLDFHCSMMPYAVSQRISTSVETMNCREISML